MTTPLKHLSYLLLSGMMMTAVACGSDATDDASATQGDTMSTMNDTAPTAPDPMAGTDTGMTSGMDAASTGNPDQDFATKATAGNLAEIRAHQTAIDRGTAADVKKHAQHMLTDHKKMGDDMKALAAKKNITLPTEPRPDKVQMQDEMNKTKQKGAEWDMAYLDAQVQDHQETIALFESGEKSVQDPEMKTLITTALPKLRDHLKMVQDARAKMK